MMNDGGVVVALVVMVVVAWPVSGIVALFIALRKRRIDEEYNWPDLLLGYMLLGPVKLVEKLVVRGKTRCSFIMKNGKRCRESAEDDGSFCADHSRVSQQRQMAALQEQISALQSQLSSLEQPNRSERRNVD